MIAVALTGQVTPGVAPIWAVPGAGGKQPPRPPGAGGAAQPGPGEQEQKLTGLAPVVPQAPVPVRGPGSPGAVTGVKAQPGAGLTVPGVCRGSVQRSAQSCRGEGLRRC